MENSGTPTRTSNFGAWLLSNTSRGPLDDTNDMPLSKGEQRKTRIAELLTALAGMRPARRRDDAARFKRLEAELILLLDAEVIRTHHKRRRES
jgi:hypothetical protein